VKKNALIRKRVKFLCDLRGMTLASLARKTGVSYAKLQHQLRGNTVSEDHKLRQKITQLLQADPWLDEQQGRIDVSVEY
jgi:transcriptional regulator with XRE-family HTH domain